MSFLSHLSAERFISHKTRTTSVLNSTYTYTYIYIKTFPNIMYIYVMHALCEYVTAEARLISACTIMNTIATIFSR